MMIDFIPVRQNAGRSGSRASPAYDRGFAVFYMPFVTCGTRARLIACVVVFPQSFVVSVQV